MPKNIHTQDSSQQRASRLLLAMGVIVPGGPKNPNLKAAAVAAPAIS